MIGYLGAQVLKIVFVHLFCIFLITIRFVLDPALNLYFELNIRGTDTVCIDWTLQVPLSFKWVEQKSS